MRSHDVRRKLRARVRPSKTSRSWGEFLIERWVKTGVTRPNRRYNYCRRPANKNVRWTSTRTHIVKWWHWSRGCWHNILFVGFSSGKTNGPKQGADKKSSTAAVVGGVLFFILVIAVAVVLFLFKKKKSPPEPLSAVIYAVVVCTIILLHVYFLSIWLNLCY